MPNFGMWQAGCGVINTRRDSTLRLYSQGVVESANSKKEVTAVAKAASRQTSARAARAASKVLRDGRTGKASKTAAGSALSQRAPKKK